MVDFCGDGIDVPEQLVGVDDRHVPPKLGALSEDYAYLPYMVDAVVSLSPGVPVPAVLVQIPEVPAVYGHLSAVRCQYAAQDFDRGAFARSVGADVAHHLAVADGKADVLEGFDFLILSVEESLAGRPEACVPFCDTVRFAYVLHRNHCASSW